MAVIGLGQNWGVLIKICINSYFNLLYHLLILCDIYKFQIVIRFYKFKSIAFIFIPFLSQPDTDDLDRWFTVWLYVQCEDPECYLVTGFTLIIPFISVILDSHKFGGTPAPAGIKTLLTILY